MIAYPEPLIPDIEVRDILTIDSLKGFCWMVTNLPYQTQDQLAAHLVALGARDGCGIALLTRAEWIVACKRRSLVHKHPNFTGVLHLTSRPRWSEDRIASPRHNFIWAVWSARHGRQGRCRGSNSPIGSLQAVSSPSRISPVRLDGEAAWR